MGNSSNDDGENTVNKSRILGMLCGVIAYAIVGAIGLYILRMSWPDYALATLEKSYSFQMLLSRLFIGAVAAIFAGILATKIAKDKGKTAWIVGGIVFCIAAYIHFFRVWNDYAAWYHFVYLFSIVIFTGGRSLIKNIPHGS